MQHNAKLITKPELCSAAAIPRCLSAPGPLLQPRAAAGFPMSINAGQAWGDSVTRGPKGPWREAVLQAGLKLAARPLHHFSLATSDMT